MKMRRRDALMITPGALFLVFPPIAVFAAGDILQLWVGWDNPIPAPALPDTDDWLRAEAAGRLIMMAAFMAAVAVGLTAIIMWAGELFRLFGTRARRRLLAASAAGLWVLILWVAAMEPRLPDIMDYPGEKFVASALEQAEKGLATRLSTINMIVRVIFVLGGLGAIVAAISCLADPVRSRPPWARQALRRLQRRRLRRYLNLAAAIMTTGLLFMVAWMRWPAFVYGGAPHAAYVAHVNALALYFGVYYSAVIASYYIPIVVILRNREARELLGRDVAPTDVGLADPGSMDIAGRGLALLVPAVAGIAPSLFELFRGGVGG